jgi:hypothetical protein
MPNFAISEGQTALFSEKTDYILEVLDGLLLPTKETT